MESSVQIYVFGDQTSAFETDLGQVLHVKDNETLTSFFEQAYYALRLEIAKLPVSQQEWFPRFASLLDLLARYGESGSNPALGLSLLCLNQLARFIKYYGEGSRPYPRSSNSYVIGLCTGSFAAAAISTSQTVFELLPAAKEAVLTAFRTGLRSMEVGNDIERHSQKASPTWSVIVGMHEKQAFTALDTFSTAKGLPRSSQPYLSSITSTSVTISGPPTILQQLLQTPPFSALKPVKLSVHAPYHAAHLYGPSDVEAILASSNTSILSSYAPRIPLLSSATGKRVVVPDYGSLLRVILRDILIEQLRWDNVLRDCATEVAHATSFSQCIICPILTNSSQTLATALSLATERDVSTDSVFMNDIAKAWTSPSSGRSGQSKIAIVGYSGRFPDAASTKKFWDLLHEGLDVHREIPKDRFDFKTHFDPTGKKKNTSKVPHGCFIEEPGLFDSRFFNMSPRESANADPGQRLAITTAYEALEMAGFVPNRTPSTQRDRVGIFYGMTSDDWREVNSGQNIDTYFIPGGNRAFTPGRINYHFKFSGPSFSIDTACSSSFAAIHTACNSLWRGDCDTAIAGGTNVMTNPDNFAGLDRGHFLSPTGNCNTFDDGANGYCRADGVGTIILKRLEDAEADKDPIHGVILGAYTNHSAEAESMTRPHVGAQAFIFNKMLSAANVDPLDVSYIEMHGTGTQAGDAVEMSSVLDVFAKKPRGSQYPLHLGSAKANVGHAESASGVTSLIKVLMMMEKNEIPPHVGIKTKINHNFPTDLKARNVNIALKPTTWRRPEDGDGKRTVFMNNFSAAGGNTALLMEDAPTVVQRHQQDARSSHLVAISAKSILSLQKNINDLVTYIDNASDLSLPALSYTTTARRMHHNYRVIVTGHDLQSVRSVLQDLAPCKDLKPIPVPAKVPNVAFVFTGQGATYVGIARQLFETVSQFRADLQRFDHIGQSQGFASFLPLIDGSATSLEELGPVITQLGTSCVQMALARLWASWGVFPSAVVGHSLGEYAALHIAGVLSASDAIFLIGTRAQLLVKHCSVGTHSMLAVKASLPIINPHLVRTNCEIACINGPNETVISDTIEEIESLSSDLTAFGFQCVKLEVPFAFHSSHVETILQEFEVVAQGVVFENPSIPFISPLLGDVVTDSAILGPSYLTRACRGTVNFLSGLEAARESGVISDGTLWVEIGSHPVCSGMIKSILGSQTTTVPSLRRNGDTWKVLSGSLALIHLAGIELQWNEYHRDFEASHEVLPLPAYNWDSKNHWIQYANDFCLTKGDSPSITIPESQPIVSTLSTPSVQRVIEQNLDVDKSTIVIESDISDPFLAGVFEQHKVNGVALCPSSLYADMALTIGDHLLKATHQDTKGLSMDVAEMVADKSIIFNGKSPQFIRASGSADWAASRLVIHFYSVTSEGKKLADHAKCIVKFENSDVWLNEWKRNTYLIKSRIEALKNGVDGGQSHKIKRGMAYKLFGAVVEYGKSYQGMQEIVLDSAQHEATAQIAFQTTEKDGKFYFSPYWIDSLGHIAGFIMNANDSVDSKSQVFLNHGWDSMRITSSFSPEKTYQVYNRMQNVGGTMFAGDTYIFDEGVVVAIYQGVRFQGLTRRVLDHILPPPNSSKAPSKAVPAPKLVASAITHAHTGHKKSNTVQKSVVVAAPEHFESKTPGVVNQALSIIAEETGLAMSELVPSSSFADFGVDSLLSLTITSRFREEIELDVESSLFVDYPTVKDLRNFICGGQDTPTYTPPSTRNSTSPPTPELDTLSEASDDTDQTSVDGDDTGVMATIRQTVAEEIGVTQEELTGSLAFSDLGMDSLLSLTILGKLHEVLDMDLPLSLFGDNNSLDEVEMALGLAQKPAVAVRDIVHAPVTSTVSRRTSPIPQATSILLQGNPKLAAKKLFLFPDGSGSATSYAPLPRISSDIVVYGLNCPYMKTPQDMKCSLEEVTPRYLEEIRRRQPSGPYYFGGWSAGGVCAFDAAQSLDRIGEKVDRLILIDSPFPIGLEKLPPRLYDFFNSIGLFGDGSKAPPAWLLPHFLAFVDSLDLYRATPFAAGHGPKTYLIWARDGVCKYPDDPRPKMNADDPKEMKWLLNNRTDFGSNGWDRLLGSDKLVIETMDNANHFTMMAGDKVEELGAFIRKAMD